VRVNKQENVGFKTISGKLNFLYELKTITQDSNDMAMCNSFLFWFSEVFGKKKNSGQLQRECMHSRI
jgi:hypothetical protein